MTTEQKEQIGGILRAIILTVLVIYLGLLAIELLFKVRTPAVEFKPVDRIERVRQEIPDDDVVNDTFAVAATLWGEARGEGFDGISAVAQIIKNRKDSSGRNFATICLQSKQFSCWTNSVSNPFLDTWSTPLNSVELTAMKNCYNIALKVVAGENVYPYLKGNKWEHFTVSGLPRKYDAVEEFYLGNHTFYRGILMSYPKANFSKDYVARKLNLAR